MVENNNSGEPLLHRVFDMIFDLYQNKATLEYRVHSMDGKIRDSSTGPLQRIYNRSEEDRQHIIDQFAKTKSITDKCYEEFKENLSRAKWGVAAGIVPPSVLLCAYGETVLPIAGGWMVGGLAVSLPSLVSTVLYGTAYAMSGWPAILSERALLNFTDSSTYWMKNKYLKDIIASAGFSKAYFDRLETLAHQHNGDIIFNIGDSFEGIPERYYILLRFNGTDNDLAFQGRIGRDTDEGGFLGYLDISEIYDEDTVNLISYEFEDLRDPHLKPIAIPMDSTEVIDLGLGVIQKIKGEAGELIEHFYSQDWKD